jgi:lipoprotein-anchoring transpeptidase ErfK/SrfK
MNTSARGSALVAALTALAALSACTSAVPLLRAEGRSEGWSAVTASITAPADGAHYLPTSTEIMFTATGAERTTVVLTDQDGQVINGAMRADHSSWVPDKQLRNATRYTAKVTAISDSGVAATDTATFTTMAQPANQVHATSQVGDDLTYGVGMPLVVNFGTDVPNAERANVEARLFVSAEPEQVGAWHWFSPHEIHFRPREYWQSGTRLSVRLAIGGLPLGGNRYGAEDVTVHASIGAKLIIEIDNATKTMTVTKNDSVIGTAPVSLGKPSSPSSRGNMVIMAKHESEFFDSSTYGVPTNSPDGYRTKVYWTQRLTWDGQYIHAAPWSESDQGKRNVSHGCANISSEKAEWLYKLTHIGDPVILKGAERPLEWANGWTDWNVSWEEYLSGSALPHFRVHSAGSHAV